MRENATASSRHSLKTERVRVAAILVTYGGDFAIDADVLTRTANDRAPFGFTCRQQGVTLPVITHTQDADLALWEIEHGVKKTFLALGVQTSTD